MMSSYQDQRGGWNKAAASQASPILHAPVQSPAGLGQGSGAG